MTLVDRHTATGAVLDEHSQPLHYQLGPAHEYEQTTTAAGLIDLSGRGKIEITGKDRVTFLHNLCTNDVKKLTPGQGCEAFLLDAKGRVLEYVHLYAEENAIWLDCAAGRSDPTLKHLDRYIIREDVQLHDRTASHALLHLTGPKAGEVLLAAGITDADGLSHCGSTQGVIEGAAVQVRRQDRAPEAGFDLLAPVEQADAVWDALLAEGSNAVAPVGLQVAEVLRIEAGIPAIGLEIGSENLAQELGRDSQAISFVKGCYLGQETVARLDALGHVNKVLHGLLFDGEAVPSPATPILLGDKPVGTVGSAAFSFGLNRAIALAILRHPQCSPGATVTVGDLTATVSAVPLRSHSS